MKRVMTSWIYSIMILISKKIQTIFHLLNLLSKNQGGRGCKCASLPPYKELAVHHNYPDSDIQKNIPLFIYPTFYPNIEGEAVNVPPTKN